LTTSPEIVLNFAMSLRARTAISWLRASVSFPQLKVMSGGFGLPDDR
jgi:hypothetical protein